MDDAATHGHRNCLSTVPDAEVVHEVFAVGFHRIYRNEEELSEITVAAGQMAQYIDLAVGQNRR